MSYRTWLWRWWVWMPLGALLGPWPILALLDIPAQEVARDRIWVITFFLVWACCWWLVIGFKIFRELDRELKMEILRAVRPDAEPTVQEVAKAVQEKTKIGSRLIGKAIQQLSKDCALEVGWVDPRTRSRVLESNKSGLAVAVVWITRYGQRVLRQEERKRARRLKVWVGTEMLLGLKGVLVPRWWGNRILYRDLDGKCKVERLVCPLSTFPERS